MVPLDDESLALLDRIIATRSHGRAIPHPVSAPRAVPLHPPWDAAAGTSGLRAELDRAAAMPGWGTSPPTNCAIPTPPPWSMPASPCRP